MNLPKLIAAFVALFTICALPSSAQTPVKGVFRNGDILTISGTVIEATKNFLVVDGGSSTYKFPIQAQTDVLDGKGQRISPDRFSKGQGVTVKVVNGDRVMEIRGGQAKLELEPLKSLNQRPGTMTLGKGKDAVTVWAAEQTIKVASKMPAGAWEKIQVGLGSSQVKDLLGDPGREQVTFEWTVWWYRYANGLTRCIGFQEGKVLDWK